MKINAGLWIDHKKAFIILLIGKMEEERTIKSYVEKQLRRYPKSTMVHTPDSRQNPPEDSKEREYTMQLNIYYDEVIAFTRNANSIFIFGPSEAKLELKKRFEKKRLGKRIAGIESADKMTKPQIAVKVREFFLKK